MIMITWRSSSHDKSEFRSNCQREEPLFSTSGRQSMFWNFLQTRRKRFNDLVDSILGFIDLQTYQKPLQYLRNILSVH